MVSKSQVQNGHPRLNGENPSAQHHKMQRGMPKETRLIDIAERALINGYHRDNHLVATLKVQRTEESGSSRKLDNTEANGSVVYTLTVTKSQYLPGGNQRPTEEMMKADSSDVEIFWHAYRTQNSGEEKVWQETLLYEGNVMSDIEILTKALDDIKCKREQVNEIFNNLKLI